MISSPCFCYCAFLFTDRSLCSLRRRKCWSTLPSMYWSQITDLWPRMRRSNCLKGNLCQYQHKTILYLLLIFIVSVSIWRVLDACRLTYNKPIEVENNAVEYLWSPENIDTGCDGHWTPYCMSRPIRNCMSYHSRQDSMYWQWTKNHLKSELRADGTWVILVHHSLIHSWSCMPYNIAILHLWHIFLHRYCSQLR